MHDKPHGLLERIDHHASILVELLCEIRDNLRTQAGVGQKLLTLAHQTKAGVDMANAQLTQVISDINTATNDVAARIDRLIAGMGDAVTPEQLAEAEAIKNRLVSLGQDPNNVVPAADPNQFPGANQFPVT